MQWWGAVVQPKQHEGKAEGQETNEGEASTTADGVTAAVGEEGASDEHSYVLSYDEDEDFPTELCEVAFIADRECALDGTGWMPDLYPQT